MADTGAVNVDLLRERASASFCCDELTYVWDGSRYNTDKRRKMEMLLFSDPEFTTHNEANMTRQQLYNENVRKHVLVWKKLKELNITDNFEKAVLLQSALGVEISGLMLHEAMFLPTINSQSSAEQLRKWRPLLDSHRIIGCYAQTELGHGTHLRALETRATYDPATKAFVLDSPTLTATKWWIGGLGCSANHAVLMAQLYTQGRCHGLHAFLVQLRDIDTHKPLPGVTVGDIGPKLGLNAVDNGFLRLNNVRIPRENMLMKHSQVLEDGTYVKPPNEKLVYGTMIKIRAQFLGSTAVHVAAAATIAVRYSLVRRQSELKPGDPEVQVFDFLTQQHKLFPWLAAAYAYRLTSQAIMQMFNEVTNEVNSGNYQRLKEMHVLGAGLKAVVTTRGNQAIEQCRLACGGHGYSLASGIPQLYGYNSVAATGEGDPTVLLLQTARYLMRSCRQASQGTCLDVYSTYLLPNSIPTSFDGRTDTKALVDAYAFRAQRIVTRTAARLQRVKSESGMSPELAWNECLVDLNNATVAHIDYVLARLFSERVAQYGGNSAVKRALVSLCQLYCINGLVSNAAELLQDGYMTPADLDSLNTALYSLYKTLRPDAVTLVDAFDFSDRFLKSAIGRYDGRVYESLYEFAAQSSLNASEVHESFHNYLKPLRDVVAKSHI